MYCTDARDRGLQDTSKERKLKCLLTNHPSSQTIKWSFSYPGLEIDRTQKAMVVSQHLIINSKFFSAAIGMVIGNVQKRRRKWISKLKLLWIRKTK